MNNDFRFLPNYTYGYGKVISLSCYKSAGNSISQKTAMCPGGLGLEHSLAGMLLDIRPFKCDMINLYDTHLAISRNKVCYDIDISINSGQNMTDCFKKTVKDGFYRYAEIRRKRARDAINTRITCDEDRKNAALSKADKDYDKDIYKIDYLMENKSINFNPKSKSEMTSLPPVFTFTRTVTNINTNQTEVFSTTGTISGNNETEKLLIGWFRKFRCPFKMDMMKLTDDEFTMVDVDERKNSKYVYTIKTTFPGFAFRESIGGALITYAKLKNDNVTKSINKRLDPEVTKRKRDKALSKANKRLEDDIRRIPS